MLVCFFVYCIDKFVYLIHTVSTLVLSYFRTRIFSTISTATRIYRLKTVYPFPPCEVYSQLSSSHHGCHANVTARYVHTMLHIPTSMPVVNPEMIAPDDLQECQLMQKEEFEVLEVCNIIVRVSQ